MAYEIEVQPASRLALVTGHGTTDAEEGHSVLVRLAADPEFEPEFGLVFDLRGFDFEPTSDLLMEGFKNVVRFKPLLRSRMAIVVGPAMETLSELSAALYATEGFESQVFWDLDEATAWVKAACLSNSAA